MKEQKTMQKIPCDFKKNNRLIVLLLKYQYASILVLMQAKKDYYFTAAKKKIEISAYDSARIKRNFTTIVL